MQEIIRKIRSESAMSLIEWLVASIIGGIAIIAMIQFSVYFHKSGTKLHNRETAAAELRQLVYEIQQAFFQRLVQGAGDPAPYEMLPSAAFVPEATETCQGILVRQRNVATDPISIRKVQYEVTCVPQKDDSNLQDVPPVHPKLSCNPVSERAIVRKSVWPNEQVPGTYTVMDYPISGMPTISLAVCFRAKTAMLQPAVEVEAGSLFKSGSQISLISERVALRISDKSESIEFVPVPKAP